MPRNWRARSACGSGLERSSWPRPVTSMVRSTKVPKESASAISISSMARTPERCPRRSRAGGERSGTVSGGRRAASEPKEKTTLRSSGSSRAGARERGEEAEQALSGAAWARREAEVVGDEAYFGAGEEV